MIFSCRKFDYENFVCSLLLRNSARSCALAVRSFNIEIAQIAEQVSQEAIGLMRFKFWEDTIEKCLTHDYRLVPKHPVAQELFKVCPFNYNLKKNLPQLNTELLFLG